jgi:hypothetical protein
MGRPLTCTCPCDAEQSRFRILSVFLALLNSSMFATWGRLAAPARAALCAAMLIMSSACARPILISTPQARSEARRAACPARCSLRQAIQSYPGRELRLWLRDGGSAVFRSPVIEGDTVFGEWRSSPDGGTPLRAALAVAEVVSAGPAKPVRSLRQESAREMGEGALQGAAAAVVIVAGVVAAFILGILP